MDEQCLDINLSNDDEQHPSWGDNVVLRGFGLSFSKKKAEHRSAPEAGAHGVPCQRWPTIIMRCKAEQGRRLFLPEFFSNQTFGG